MCASACLPLQINELGGLRGSLVVVDVLLLVHDKRWDGGGEEDSGLEGCVGLGEGKVRRNVPPIGTT